VKRETGGRGRGREGGREGERMDWKPPIFETPQRSWYGSFTLVEATVEDWSGGQVRAGAVLL